MERERDRVSVGLIISEVSRAFHVPVRSILSERQNKQVCQARFAAMWLSRELTTYSFPRIGRVFNRDHTTVMDACRRAEEMRRTDDIMLLRTRQLLRDFGEDPVEFENMAEP